MIMKKMIYQASNKREVLATGEYLGFTYYILNLGTHPTAYIKISENHEYYKKDYDDIDLSVHGGLTFASDKLNLGKNNIINGWFIGWDYAHCDDYLGYEIMYPQWINCNMHKKWTTEEILEEVKKACKELFVSEIKDTCKYVDKIEDCIDKIDDLTSDIDLKFPFKIDSLISIIREKSFELEDYLKEELKYKEGELNE